MVPLGHTLLLLSSLLMCFFTFVLLTYYTPGHGGFGQQADSAPQKPGWAGRSSQEWVEVRCVQGDIYKYPIVLQMQICINER